MLARIWQAIQESPVAFGILVIVGLILAYKFWNRTIQHTHAKTWGTMFEKAVAAESAQGVRRKLTSGLTAHNNAIFPLRWHPEIGEFIMDLNIRGTRFQVVPDTGSMYVIVSGQDCVNCNRKQGVYPGGGQNTGIASTVYYGSQTDDITWFIDNFDLPNVGNIPVEFGVITAATTTMGAAAPANVFGLAGSLTRKEKTPFLDQVMFENQIFPPWFFFDFLGGPGKATFGIGMYPFPKNVDDSNTIMFLNQHETAEELGIDIGVDFYLAELDSVRVNGAPIANAPTHCMFDTGNTYLSLGSKFYPSFRGAVGTNSLLEFRFAGGVVLQYQLGMDPTQHVDQVDFLDTPPFNNQLLILGNAWMDGRLWMFNLDKHSLTIGA